MIQAQANLDQVCGEAAIEEKNCDQGEQVQQ